jgi:transcriptional regulator with XRE-family HTH domain
MAITVNVTTLRQLRLAHDLTVEEAAVKCGIASGYWSELETGRRLGTPKKIKQIADAFGLHYYDVVAIILRTHEVAHGDGGNGDD